MKSDQLTEGWEDLIKKSSLPITTKGKNKDLMYKVNNLIGELNSKSWFKAVNTDDLKESSLTVEDLNETSDKFMNLFAQERAALLAEVEEKVKEYQKQYAYGGEFQNKAVFFAFKELELSLAELREGKK